MEQLDQNVIRLAKAIRTVESRNKPVLPQEGAALGGASRYQYTHDTWKSVAGKYLGNPNAELNLKNENKATYYRIKEWKDKGYKPDQIASMWNAGEGRPNAHKEGLKGINKFGVEYNVPEYVAKVGRAYKSLAGALSPNVAQAQTTEEKTSVFDTLPERRTVGEKIANTGTFIANDLLRGGQGNEDLPKPGALGQVGRELLSTTVGSRGYTGVFSNIGKTLAAPANVKTLEGAQKLSQESQTKLIDRIKNEQDPQKRSQYVELLRKIDTDGSLQKAIVESGGPSMKEILGTGGNALLTVAGGAVASGGSKLGKIALQEGAIGAGFGITDPLARDEDPTIGSVVAGGALGAVGGVVGVGVGRALAPFIRRVTPAGRAKVSQEAVDKSVESLKELFPTQRGQRFIQNVEIRKGDEPFRLIVESGALRRPDIKGNKINTLRGSKLLRESQEEWNNLLEEALDPVIEPRLATIEDVAERSLRNIDNLNYTPKTKEQLRKQLIDDLEAVRREYGDSFNLQTLNEIKRKFWREAFPEGKALSDVDRLTRNRKYIAGRGMMETIEDLAQNPDIRELNSTIGTFAESQKILEELSKQTLRKGQLGRYVLQGIGTGVGTSAGGPLGGLVGALGGDIVTNVLQRLSVTHPLRSALIKYIRNYRPDLKGKLNDFIRTTGQQVDNAPRLNAGPIPAPRPRSVDVDKVRVETGPLPPGRGRVLEKNTNTIPSLKNNDVISKLNNEIQEIVEKTYNSKLVDIVEGKDSYRMKLANGEFFFINKKILSERTGIDSFDEFKQSIVGLTKGADTVSDLLEEAKKFDNVGDFVKAKLDEKSFITKEPITVYRGEGKGIGNETLVSGRYFADSEEFASNFGKVTKSEIPKGTKVFDLDTIKNGSEIISDDALVNPQKLTDFLVDNGFEYTKNTNSRGVEYVKLRRYLDSEVNRSTLERYKKLDDMFGDLADKYKTSNAFANNVYKRIENDSIKDFDPAYKILTDFYKTKKSGDIPDINKASDVYESQLEEIWKQANKIN